MNKILGEEMDKYYKILEINKTATLEEVKSAYRTLSKKYHPDKHHGNDLEELAAEKFKQIKEAYEKIIEFLSNNKNSTNTNSNEEYNYNRYEDEEEPSFTLYGFQFNFPEELFLYNEIRREVNLDMESLLSNYKAKYYSYKNLDNFLKNDYSYVSDIVLFLVRKIVNVCIKNGYDMYSAETFFTRAKKIILEDYNELYLELEERVDLIERNKNVRNSGRKLKHEFKFEKTIFTHAGNLIEKASIAVEASNYKKSLYEDKDIVYVLFQIVEKLLEKTLDLVCEVIGISGSEVLNKDKAEAIYENINKYPKDILKDKICDVILNNPYLTDVYKTALIKVGDADYELQNFADIFGVPLLTQKNKIMQEIIEEERRKGNLLQVKEKIKAVGLVLGLDTKPYIVSIETEIEKEKIEILKKMYTEGDTSTEESTLKLKEKIESLSKEYKVDITTYIEELDKKLEIFDLDFRKILGTSVICETRKDIEEIYTVYKSEFEELKKILETVENKLINLNSKLSKIKEFEIKEIYKNKIIEELEEKKEELVSEYKTNVSTPKGSLVKTFLISFIIGIVLVRLIFYFDSGFFRAILKIGLGIFALGAFAYPFSVISERKNQMKELNELGIE